LSPSCAVHSKEFQPGIIVNQASGKAEKQENQKSRKNRESGKAEEQENQSIRKSRRAGKTGEIKG
jgi:hypothetical protein